MDSANTMRAKVSSKGWVVIPVTLRRRYGLKPGMMVEFQEEGDKIILIPEIQDPIEALYGKLAEQSSLTKALLEERAQELEREETRLRAR
jgi:AbrB family looped-hinge helix DNA binding protein